jgi:segregation and condensation protein A
MEQDALSPNQDHLITLSSFEGPLDLLLYLIKKDELDIYDIPIISVTNQYIDSINNMEQLDLEVAGEFFVMASTLMYIKSRYLLPKKDRDVEEPTDEASDPRWELVEKLIEYKKFKNVAQEIESLIRKTNDYFPREFTLTKDSQMNAQLKPVERVELWNVFNNVLRRLSERIEEGEITEETITVSDRMSFILSHLKQTPTFYFSNLFESKTTLNSIVATFLAVLELTRLGELQIVQNEAFDDILCQRP